MTVLCRLRPLTRQQPRPRKQPSSALPGSSFPMWMHWAARLSATPHAQLLTPWPHAPIRPLPAQLSVCWPPRSGVSRTVRPRIQALPGYPLQCNPPRVLCRSTCTGSLHNRNVVPFPYLISFSVEVSGGLAPLDMRRSKGFRATGIPLCRHSGRPLAGASYTLPKLTNPTPASPLRSDPTLDGSRSGQPSRGSDNSASSASIRSAIRRRATISSALRESPGSWAG